MSDEKAKLSYEPGKVPSPVTSHDWYAYASLVEQRAVRSLLTELVAAIRDLTVAISGAKATTKQK